MAEKEFLENTMKRLADEGKLVEAGWIGLRLAVGLENAPAEQLREMRLAFLGGAQHLFSSIMTVLDPTDEPTDADLNRMHLIAADPCATGPWTAAMGRDRVGVREYVAYAVKNCPYSPDTQELLNNIDVEIAQSTNEHL